MSRIIKSPEISDEEYLVSVPQPVGPEDGSQEADVRQLSPEELQKRAGQLLEQAEKQAGALLEQAKTNARKLMEDAGTQAGQLKEESRTRGFAEGKEQGHREGLQSWEKKIEELVKTASQLFQSLHEEKEKVIGAAQPQLVELACTIAGSVVRSEVQKDNEVVVRIVRQAIALATRKEKLKIRLNPEDLERVRSHCDELIRSDDELKEIEMGEDPRIERGGCVIETVAGSVDARLGRQLEEFRKTLKDLV